MAIKVDMASDLMFNPQAAARYLQMVDVNKRCTKVRQA
jgi:hypothetical protein